MAPKAEGEEETGVSDHSAACLEVMVRKRKNSQRMQTGYWLSDDFEVSFGLFVLCFLVVSFSIFQITYLLFCICFVCMYVCALHAYICGTCRSQKRVSDGSPRAGVTDSCEPSCGSCGLNLD